MFYLTPKKELEVKQNGEFAQDQGHKEGKLTLLESLEGLNFE